MIKRNRIVHLISIMTIGLYTGCADATDQNKTKTKEDYFRECPNDKFEKFFDHNFSRATHERYDPTAAEHMETARGLTKEDMSSCMGRNKFQSKEEFNKIFGSIKGESKKNGSGSTHG